MYATKSLGLLAFGISLAIFGIALITGQPHVWFITQRMRSETTLTEGTFLYKFWTDFILEFRVYIFHVSNPEEVMKGESPKLVEFGPYVYDEHAEKIIMGTDDEKDTVEFFSKRTMYFNKTKSGSLSDEDELTILNPAYIGIILTIADSFPSFLSKMGNDIPLLFPDTRSIFVRGRVKDILFDGLPLACDPKKFPQLQMICGFLKTKRPPILRTTAVDGTYAYSYFNKINGTTMGPYVVNRGVRNDSDLGNIKAFKGLVYSEFWNSKNCSPIEGTEGSIWPATKKHASRLYSYAPDMCRSMYVDYKDDVAVHGMMCRRYMTSENVWNMTDDECYCPRDSKRKIKCLPRGLLDMKKCQQAPVITSEPHFFNADPMLLSYPVGLEPNYAKHPSYVIMDPLSGMAIAGYKRLQLNIKMSRQPVELLANVSDGYIPLLWVEEGTALEPAQMPEVIQIHRLFKVLSFLEWLPTLVGVSIILIARLITQESRKVTVLPKNRIETKHTIEAVNGTSYNDSPQ